MVQRRFVQADVFSDRAFHGNPLAVVVDGEGLDDDTMARIANWTNLSETTFLLPPTDPGADYRVRIFTTTAELPFAGHPTLGSCRAWLDHGGAPRASDRVVQQCGAGLVTIRVDDRLAFAAPPLIRSGPVDDELRATIEGVVGVPVIDASWADNGPGWVAAELADADAVLSVRPNFSAAADLKLGLIGRADGRHGTDAEVRAFFPGPNGHVEDPVTGSLNASIGQWLMARDPALTAYVAHQGTTLGRNGHVHVERDGETIWIGGDVVTPISGTIDV